MPILTVELDLPEPEYRFATTLSPAEQRRVASMATAVAFATVRNIPPVSSTGDTEEPQDDTPLTQDEIVGLAESVAQLDAGLGSDGDAFFERLYKERGWKLKP
ncbi:MAG: hypothetical protein H7Y38_20815 [Armatimonadetes bacterium]|nr:hypothetical protein [Armatimonadota bacterium]